SPFLKIWREFQVKFSLYEPPQQEHTFFHLSPDPLSSHSYSSRLDRFFIPSSLSTSLSSSSVSVDDRPLSLPLSHKGVFYRHLSDHRPVCLFFANDFSPKAKK